MGGTVGDPDECGAWLSAARQKHLYSKIYLLQNWLDDMFVHCGLDLTQSEVEDMLTRAEVLATWDQAREDMAQLRAGWVER